MVFPLLIFNLLLWCFLIHRILYIILIVNFLVLFIHLTSMLIRDNVFILTSSLIFKLIHKIKNNEFYFNVCALFPKIENWVFLKSNCLFVIIERKLFNINFNGFTESISYLCNFLYFVQHEEVIMLEYETTTMYKTLLTLIIVLLCQALNLFTWHHNMP